MIIGLWVILIFTVLWTLGNKDTYNQDIQCSLLGTFTCYMYIRRSTEYIGLTVYTLCGGETLCMYHLHVYLWVGRLLTQVVACGLLISVVAHSFVW